MMTDFEAHLTRQMVFSRATFGPGARTKGVIDHIRKKLVEVEESRGSAKEWVDVVILALDGLTRSIQNQHNGPSGKVLVFAHDAALSAVRAIVEKQGINELRDWPDWRTMSEDQAIEHVERKHD
jgi:transcription antitermination factor NusA-like protein